MAQVAAHRQTSAKAYQAARASGGGSIARPSNDLSVACQLLGESCVTVHTWHAVFAPTGIHGIGIDLVHDSTRRTWSHDDALSADTLAPVFCTLQLHL